MKRERKIDPFLKMRICLVSCETTSRSQKTSRKPAKLAGRSSISSLTSDGCKAESITEPSNGFKYRILRVRIQQLGILSIAFYMYVSSFRV